MPGTVSVPSQGSALPDEVAKAAPSARMGKYVRIAKLGSGGMGEVWKAWDTELERWVALKLLRHEDPRELARFTREARTAAALSHPNIAAVYEAGDVAGRHYIAMALIVGRTLDRLARKDRRILVTMVRDAARAVGFAHKRGIVHRDLKPTNLMVQEDESGTHVVVMDFGLARRVEGGAKLSKTGTLAGTPAYMSPEQSRGRPASARSDVYSLGVTLYELLVGRPPFESEDVYDLLRRITDSEPAPLRSLDRGIERDLETIVLKCLEKDPLRRYATAEALARDLDRWLAGEPVLARPVGSWYRVQKRLAQRKAVVAAGLSAAVILLLVGWWLTVGSPRAEHLRLMAEGTNLWAEARGLAMLGVDPDGTRLKARKARERFDQAITIREEAPAQWMRGRCLQLEGNQGDAFRAFERAGVIDPTHSESRIDLAKFLLARYQWLRSPEPLSLIDGQTVSLEIRKLPPESTEERSLRERAAQLLDMGAVPPSQQKLMSGLLSLGKERYEAAAKALDSYTKQERWDAHALFLQGVCLYIIRELPGALDALNRAAASGGNDGSLFQLRGHVLFQLGLLDEAIRDYSLAIEKASKLISAWEGRGITRCAKGLHQEAWDDFDRAIQIDPGMARLYDNRGVEHKHLGRFDKAIDDHTKAIELCPDWAYYFNRAIALHELRRHQEAIEDLNKVTMVNPSFARAFNLRGRAKHGLGREDEAVADWKRAVELDSTLATAWMCLGVAKGNRGEFKAAIADFTKAIELDPRDATSLHGRGASYYMLEHYDKAIDDCTRALAINKNLRDAYVHRGESKRFKGLYKEAILDYTDALRLNPNDAGALHWRAHAHHALGDRKDAVADCRQALAVAPAGWEWRAEVEKELKEFADERSTEK